MTPMTDRETLIATRALIEDPARWTTGELARNAHGKEVEPIDPEATCWCLEGALFKTMGSSPYVLIENPAWDLIRSATIELFDERMPFVINDHGHEDEGGHAAVLRVLDRAIKLATD